jgi:hypothetical protein
MRTLRFKRFTKLSFLRGVSREILTRFFERFTSQLGEKKVELPRPNLSDDEFFRTLSRLLLSPEELPDEFGEALFAIDEMASEGGQERLQNALAQAKTEMTFELGTSYGDLAMRIWLTEPLLFAQAYNEQQLQRLSSFEYFGTRFPANQRKPLASVGNEMLAGIRADLDRWFGNHNRGEETTQVSQHEFDGEWWFIVRHGDTFMRTAKVERQETTCLHFRPAKDDVVVFSPLHDEIRIHAATKGEKNLYRRAFGCWLRGDGEYFSERRTFTLEPLRVDGPMALVWNGGGNIDRIILREWEVAWGGHHKEVVIRRADDVFAAIAASGRKGLTEGGELVRAVFDVYFTGVRKPRKVQVRLPNALKVGRHCDAALVQAWLSDKRFRDRENSTLEPPFVPLAWPLASARLELAPRTGEATHN